MPTQGQHGIALLRPRTLEELIAEFGGAVDDGVDVGWTIRSIGASDRRGTFDLAPVLHARGAAAIATNARVLLVSTSIASRVVVGRRWVHPQSARILATLLAVEEPAQFVAPSGLGVDATDSIVASTAQIGLGVTLGARTRIGPNAIVYSNVTLGAGVTIGAGAIVGAPGFGFADNPLDASVPPIRFPHRAGVVLEDGVEIGPLCTIDAGVLFPTTLGKHTKLDAHVHVGHGVQIGAHCRIAAQVGFAGSVVVEDDVHIGGQAGFGDHVHIGRGARIAGKAGVIGDVAAGAVVAGYPAVPRMRWLRGHARLYRK